MSIDHTPSQPDPLSGYLWLAKQLWRGEIEESDLASLVTSLPPLSAEWLESAAGLSQAYAPTNPHLGWAIARVIRETAASQQIDMFLRAKADWYFGRAENNFFRPQLATEPLRQARAAFVILGKDDWVTACDWQANVLPWASNNLLQTAEIIQTAIDEFSKPDSSFSSFRLESMLSLAYTQILRGNYLMARELLDNCQAEFRAANNSLGILRCQRLRSNLLNRQSRNEEALQQLNSSLALAREMSVPVEELLGLIVLSNVYFKNKSSDDLYRDAEETMLKAFDLSRQLRLPFWQALVESGLADVHISRGELSEAERRLETSNSIMESFNLDAPLASGLISAGWLNTYRADYDLAISQLEKSIRLSQHLGNNYLYGVGLMHLGEVYLEMQRYQQSLHFLERGIDVFSGLGAVGRAAECGLRLARCWTYLGRHEQASVVLDFVEKNARAAKQENIFPFLYIRRAENAFMDGNQSVAIVNLRKAIEIALEYDERSGAALAQRLLGDALIEQDEMEEAAENLQMAEKSFNEIGMVVEQAACKISWGKYFIKQQMLDRARESFRQAAKIGQTLAPDIIWQAQAGLAALEELAGKDSEALGHYRKVITALVQLRQGMWQPALAGNLLRQSNDALKRALRVAVRLNSAEDAINAIEAGKARVMANLFKFQQAADPVESSPELSSIAADIRWRQEKVRATGGNNDFRKSADLRQLRVELLELVKSYDLLKGQLERKREIETGKVHPLDSDFNLSSFCTVADNAFGKNWLAINYFLTGKHLTAVLIDSDSVSLYETVVPGRVRLILSELDLFSADGRWQQGELDLLGRWLLPEEIVRRLTPETTVFIAPHSQLHRLPWSALTTLDQPLVSKAIPVVVPSLQTLSILVERVGETFRPEKGLLVGVSNFNGRHNPLKKTITEVQSLQRLFPESTSFIDQEATWENILESFEGNDGETFSFLHLATHAFADRVSGRLSGLALHDRDVWLDELWELAPLPPLVTLSACSGSKSRMYEGDEQVGLATTCLAAGASHVVASLWPIGDGAAAEFMESFYNQLLLGSQLAPALANAQREAIKENKPLVDWAGFRFNGMPMRLKSFYLNQRQRSG